MLNSLCAVDQHFCTDPMSPADQSVGKQLPYEPEFSGTATGRLAPRSLLFFWQISNLFNEEYLSVLSRPMPRMNCEFFINVKPKWGKKNRTEK